MKKAILLITLITMTMFLIPSLSIAAPENYLNSEGSSYGFAISQNAKAEAVKARGERLLTYQEEIAQLSIPACAENIDTADARVSAADDVTPQEPNETLEPIVADEPDDQIVTNPDGNDAGGTDTGTAADEPISVPTPEDDGGAKGITYHD